MFFSESFLNVTKETLIDLLKSDKIHLGELDIFIAVIIWGKHQLIHRLGIQITSQKSSANSITVQTNSNGHGGSTQNSVGSSQTPTKTVISYGMDGNSKILSKENLVDKLKSGLAESLTERNLSISEQKAPQPSPELSISELNPKHEDDDETDKDGVDEDDEEEVDALAYSALNPESMLNNSSAARKQDADELKQKKERIQKIVNYTHDKNFCQQLAKLLYDILHNVRFPTLDPIELYEFVEISKVVPNELLLEAYRAHSLQNRVDLFNSARLKVREGSLFYVNGVCTDVPISKLKGWCLYYHKPYHHQTSEADIQAAKGTRILIGARHKNSSALALCAMGMKQKVFRKTF